MFRVIAAATRTAADRFVLSADTHPAAAGIIGPLTALADDEMGDDGERRTIEQITEDLQHIVAVLMPDTPAVRTLAAPLIGD